MARRVIFIPKPKKKPNRYNPNAPDWRKVHLPIYLGKWATAAKPK